MKRFECLSYLIRRVYEDPSEPNISDITSDKIFFGNGPLALAKGEGVKPLLKKNSIEACQNLVGKRYRRHLGPRTDIPTFFGRTERIDATEVLVALLRWRL